MEKVSPDGTALLGYDRTVYREQNDKVVLGLEPRTRETFEWSSKSRVLTATLYNRVVETGPTSILLYHTSPYLVRSLVVICSLSRQTSQGPKFNVASTEK